VKQVEITIPKRGLARGSATIDVETSGFAGVGCKDITKIFTVLGSVETEEEKGEMYETESDVEWTTEGGGGCE